MSLPSINLRAARSARLFVAASLAVVASGTFAVPDAFAQKKDAGAGAKKAAAPVEDDYYKLIDLPIPEPLVLEVGALEMRPDGQLLIGTRRGDVYVVRNAFSDPPQDVKYVQFAQGMHEILGLAWRNGWLYAVQRGEVSRLKDTDGDDRADVVETVSDAWDVTGDYHEYAFGSRFDKNGHLWVVLCLTGSFSSNAKYRGWCLRFDEDGKMIPTCSGIRSPGGIGMNDQGDVFYTDNQGPWNGTCSLKHLVPGSFQGHPDGLKWWDAKHAPNLGKKPAEPNSGSRFVVEAERIPEYLPPAILFPYGKMGRSASGIACDTTAGRFGPFPKQLFVADQSASTVMRCSLEKVKDRWQGAVFPFRAGFHSGTLPLMMTADGSLFAGGTNRGWGSAGRKGFSLERLVWTGRVPFEIHAMRARPDGFELTFTEPVDSTTALDPQGWKIGTYTYIFQSNYGSPEVDHSTPTIRRIEIAPDNRTLRLVIDGLKPGHVHELTAEALRSKDGLPLLHKTAYYTLNNVPEK